MARIRSVHPGLFTDETFVALSDAAQIFFIGLWTEADDQGVFDWKPTTLRMRLRGAKDGSVEPLLSELTEANCIRIYEVNGRKLGAIRNFRRFQKPKTPNATHVINDDIRSYVGLSVTVSEIDGDENGPFPPNGEKSPLMEGRVKGIGVGEKGKVVSEAASSLVSTHNKSSLQSPVSARANLNVSAAPSSGFGLEGQPSEDEQGLQESHLLIALRKNRHRAGAA